MNARNASDRSMLPYPQAALDYFDQRGIDPVYAFQRAGVRCVSHHDAAAQGFAVPGHPEADLTGLMFPYHGTDLVRLRPFTTTNGTKYVAPARSRNRLYLPEPQEDVLQNTAVSALVVEGEAKAVLVKQTVGPAALVVGIAGAWNWRTSDKAKVERADGPGTETTRTHSRPLEDFTRIAWRDRVVTLLFDSDAETNPQVGAAERALAAELTRRGAHVRIAEVPALPGHGKTGVDDWLLSLPVGARKERLRELTRGAMPRRRVRRDERDTHGQLEVAFEPMPGLQSLFHEWVEPITDAPGIYEPFTWMAVLSATVGRGISFTHGASPTYCNTFTLLLGSSSYFRKSTMCSIGERFIQAVRPESVMPNEMSPERLIKKLSEQPTATFVWREFTGFITRASKDYMGGIKEQLMELYDSPSLYKRELQSSVVEVKDPYLTILSAAATSWMADAMKAGDLRSGFLNRFGIVLATQKTRHLAMPPAADRQLEGRIIAGLRDLQAIRGEASLRHLERPYAAWLRDIERDATHSSRPEELSAFYTRLSVTALKYAVLLQVASTGSLYVSPEALDLAIQYADYHRAVISHLLAVEFAPTDTAKRQQRVLQVITKKPGIKRGDLMRSTGFDKREMDRALETLLEQGNVYQADKGYWPAEKQ